MSPAIGGAFSRGFVAVLTGPLVAYQRWISPAYPATCRFHPTCSAYAVTALRTRGPVVGLALALRRLARCHPWNPGGLDPVPPSRRGAPPASPSTYTHPMQELSRVA